MGDYDCRLSHSHLHSCGDGSRAFHSIVVSGFPHHSGPTLTTGTKSFLLDLNPLSLSLLFIFQPLLLLLRDLSSRGLLEATDREVYSHEISNAGRS